MTTSVPHHTSVDPVTLAPVSTSALPSVSRVSAFDGLRGLAILLVILSHGWTLWPIDGLERHDWLNAWFISGNYAVSVFFVAGAFLFTGSMLRNVGSREGLQPGSSILRRLVRLGGQTYAMLVVWLIVAAIDGNEDYAGTSIGESALHIVTYTWNWFVIEHALTARPDLGHMWYISVDLQVFLFVLATVWMLRRHPQWLIVALIGMWVVVVLWRSHVFGTEYTGATLRTSARADAPLAGAIAAALLPYIGKLKAYAGPVAAIAALALVPLLYATSDVKTYFGWGGALLDLTLVALLLALSIAPRPGLVAKMLGNRLLAAIGVYSFSIYLWHYPIFWWVSKHTDDWGWGTKAVLAYALTAIAVVFSERVVQTKTQQWLDSPRWSEMRTAGGLNRYLLQMPRQIVSPSKSTGQHRVRSRS